MNPRKHPKKKRRLKVEEQWTEIPTLRYSCSVIRVMKTKDYCHVLTT